VTVWKGSSQMRLEGSITLSKNCGAANPPIGLPYVKTDGSGSSSRTRPENCVAAW